MAREPARILARSIRVAAAPMPWHLPPGRSVTARPEVRVVPAIKSQWHQGRAVGCGIDADCALTLTGAGTSWKLGMGFCVEAQGRYARCESRHWASRNARSTSSQRGRRMRHLALLDSSASCESQKRDWSAAGQSHPGAGAAAECATLCCCLPHCPAEMAAAVQTSPSPATNNTASNPEAQGQAWLAADYFKIAMTRLQRVVAYSFCFAPPAGAPRRALAQFPGLQSTCAPGSRDPPAVARLAAAAAPPLAAAPPSSPSPGTETETDVAALPSMQPLG